MRGKKPTAVGDILAGMKVHSPLGAQLEQAAIWERWPELAGERLSAHGQPHSITDNRLVIHAESPVWLHKFAFYKWDIVKRVNRMAGRELISDVFVTLAPDDAPTPPQHDV